MPESPATVAATRHDRLGALRPLIDLWRAYAGDGPVPEIAHLPGPARAEVPA